MHEVGRLSDQLLRRHQAAQSAYKMEELPGSRSVGDRSFSTREEGDEPYNSTSSKLAGCPAAISASECKYRKLASLWHKLWHRPSGWHQASAPDKQKKHIVHVDERRASGSGMDRLEVIWDVTWEATAATDGRDLARHKGRESALADALAAGASPGIRAWDPIWAISAACGPISLSGCGHGIADSELTPKDLGARVDDRFSGRTTSLMELPGFRSGEGMEELDREGSLSGGIHRRNFAELEEIVQLWDEQWLGGAHGEFETENGGGPKLQRNPSLINRLLSALTRSRKTVEESSEISDELKDWYNKVIPPYPPGYVDPACV